MRRRRQPLPGLSGRTLLVVGDLMMDRYFWGRVSRISPEAPVPVVDVERESAMLGGAANVAANVAALGGKVYMAGVVGDDEAGRRLAAMLKDAGISPDGVMPDPQRPTTLKTRVIAHSQHVVRFDYEQRDEIGSGVRRRLYGFLDRVAPDVDGVIVSDYAKGLITRSLMNRIRKNYDGKFIAVDPKVPNMDLYRGVSLVTPNRKEATAATGIEITDDRSLKAAAKHLFGRLHCDAVLITRGEKGMSLVRRSGRAVHVSALARHVFDVTGAGDTVIATLGLLRATGRSLESAVRAANVAAGIVVGEVGTSVVRPEVLAEYLKREGVHV